MILALLLACIPDDVKESAGTDTSSTSTQDSTSQTQTTDTEDSGTSKQDITGDWLSEGNNLSPLFQASGFSKIVATFEKNGDSTAVATDTKGKSYTFKGTYSVDTSTLPGTIEVVVLSPIQATSEGIWQVDGDKLTYEVAQIDPDQGFSPPTPKEGFGSTTGPNVEAGANIQVYVRQ